MPDFAKGTVVLFTLDEYDILTIDGQTKLTVTPTGHHAYETQTIGHQVIGPFGVVTSLSLTGLGDGSYVAGPSNQALPVSMVDISAAQQAAPTAAMLQATSTLYQLNAAPYTIYRSNGSALIDVGSGVGATAFSDLSDKASADLPALNTALNTALGSKQATLSSGTNIKTINGASVLGSGDLVVASAAPTSTTFTTAIPFDAIRYMPQQTVSAPLAFTINSTGSVIGGECQISLQADGTNLPTFTPFTLAGSQDYLNVNGQVNDICFFRTPGGYRYGVVIGASADIDPPRLVSAVVENAAPTVVVLTFDESLSGTLAAASAFTVSGHTVLSRAAGATANIINLTLSAAFVGGETRLAAYTRPGTNNLADAAGNQVVNFSARAITNNVADTTVPTISAMSVSNATPTHVDVTFSEPMLSTISAAAAWAIGSHTVSAATYVDSTHIYLTVDAFVAGESRTGSYTQPGSNKMQDLATNLLATVSGVAITNNVLGAGGLSRTITNSPGAVDLTAVGTLDWIKVRPAALNDHKDGANLITVGLVNFENKGWTHSGTAFSWTNGDTTGPSGTSGSVNDSVGFDIVAVGTGKYQFIFPAGTATKTAYVWLRPDSGSRVTVRATLSDSSSSPIVDSTTVTGSEFSRLYTYTYSAASAGQSLTVSIETGSGLSDVSYVMVEGAAYA